MPGGPIRRSSNPNSGPWLQCSSKGALVLSNLRSWEGMADLRVVWFALMSLMMGRRSDGCSSAGMCFTAGVWTDGSTVTGGRAHFVGLLWLWERWRRAPNQLLSVMVTRFWYFMWNSNLRSLIELLVLECYFFTISCHLDGVCLDLKSFALQLVVTLCDSFLFSFLVK